MVKDAELLRELRWNYLIGFVSGYQVDLEPLAKSLQQPVIANKSAIIQSPRIELTNK
jgi:hypothetical protein